MIELEYASPCTRPEKKGATGGRCGTRTGKRHLPCTWLRDAETRRLRLQHRTAYENHIHEQHENQAATDPHQELQRQRSEQILETLCAPEHPNDQEAILAQTQPNDRESPWETIVERVAYLAEQAEIAQAKVDDLHATPPLERPGKQPTSEQVSGCLGAAQAP